MTTSKIPLQKRYDKSKKDNIVKWIVPEKQKEDIKKYIDAYENGDITNRIGTNMHVIIERELDYLKVSLQSINKDKPIKEDITTFKNNLIQNKIKRYNQKTKKHDGEPYSLKTKKAMLEAVKKYLKWKFPDKPEILVPLEIKINSKKNDYNYLTLDEIDKLYKNCKNDEERYFIAVLFSSGARIEEFLNIRYSDITLPKGEENFVKIRLRSEFTKTESRTISLYYKNCLEATRDFLKQRENEGIKPEEAVLTKKYGNLRGWLSTFGKRVLNKRVSCHQFRHSSATWLASRLNRQQLCIYFGWKFSSNMPDRYISRNGVDMEEANNKFSATELEELKNRLDRTEQKLSRTEETLKLALDSGTKTLTDVKERLAKK
ncbi:MAG: site-specific integrase [Candidatus Pacearchaeota archaeon]|nr:site-specific integrase [Candidatus Pacearchaeota archaeon]